MKPGTWLAFSLCVGLTLAPSSGGAEADDVSLLSYNVHGLFRLAAADNPRDRMPTIGWLASRYDVVMLQEDFEFHTELRTQMPGSVPYRGNGIGWEPRLWAARIVLLPFILLVPNFSPPYGAGVSTFIREDMDVDSRDRVPFSDCNGWVGENGDCWARKGYLRVRFRTPNGAEVDVYNTHAEAGPSERSVATRRSHMEEMAEGIEEFSRDRAVIVAGDLNLSFARPGDAEIMKDFRARLGLDDSGAGAETPFWRERSFILYRGGSGVELEGVDKGEDLAFLSGNRALSDHPPVYVNFRVHHEETP